MARAQAEMEAASVAPTIWKLFLALTEPWPREGASKALELKSRRAYEATHPRGKAGKAPTTRDLYCKEVVTKLPTAAQSCF